MKSYEVHFMCFETFSAEIFIISKQYKILTSFYVGSSNFNILVTIEPLCEGIMVVIPNEGGQEYFHKLFHINVSTTVR